MKKILSILLCLCLCLGMCACGAGYEAYTLKPNEYLLGEDSADAGSGGRNNTPQLTEADIQTMNGGNASFVYSDEGYLTFLQGRFSKEPVDNYEDAIAALNGVASLIGLGAGSEFFAVYGGSVPAGYTYYTFQQRYGGVTVQYATLRVIVDPKGYTAGLSCSFTPNLGIADEGAGISAEAAEAAVRAAWPSFSLTVYSESTEKVAVTLGEVSYHAWAVFTNNPNSNADDFGMRYIEHFVAVSGEYLYCLPVATLNTDSMDAFQAEAYFSGLEQHTLNTEVTRWDGSRESLSVPVAYNPSTRLWYLADISRQIMVADFYGVMYQGVLDFVTSTDGTTWPNGDLLAYDRYIKAYDFYAAQGIHSVDGAGTPILVCTGYCDSTGAPVNNAGHCGINQGWVCFGVSDVNNYSEALDVVGHEFTHGVTNCSFVGNLYCNETGAINEAYSDIMGNLCELLTGSTTDTQWLMGENCGQPLRSLRSPHDFGQPISLNDAYYQFPVNNPAQENDLGGVHQNSSLLSQMSYKLYEAGMTLEEQRALWVTSIELLTPLSGYREVHGALRMSMDINGFDARYKQVLTDAFTDAGMLG